MEGVAPHRAAPWFAGATDTDWDALYVDQLPRIYNFFRYRVGAHADVEDLTSVTFEKAWRARHRYRRDLGGFTTWMLAIARNVAVDHYRAARRHEPLTEAAGVATRGSPEDDALRRSDVQRLAALLGQLPDRERELVALKYGAGATNRAISRLTGLSESNVGTILHRVVQQLRAGWADKE